MGNKNNNCQNKDQKNVGGKKGEPITVVLKIDFHCTGCVRRILKCVKAIEGVEYVKAETEAKKLTVVGKVVPLKLKEKLEQKMKKKVDLISPQPKKEKNGENKENEGQKTEQKKPKEPAIIAAHLKMALHCQGCVDKIHRLVSKTKGVLEVSLDRQKELVMVKGTMDAKALAEALKEKLKRPVEIVQPKKEKEDGNGDSGKKGKKGAGGTENDNGRKGGDQKVEENKKLEYLGWPRYGCPYYVYGYPDCMHAPEFFSDEDPNACSIM